MIDEDKLKSKIEGLKSNLIHGACSSQIAMETRCKEEAYNEVLAIIDSMQEEHKLKPKFQEGNKIVYVGERKELDTDEHTILYVYDDMYVTTCGKKIPFKFQDDYQLVEEHVSDDLEKVVEEIVDPIVLNAYGVKEIANRLRRIMIDSVNEDLEEAASFYANTHTEWFDHEGNPHVSPAFKAGAEWQKEQMMAKAIDGEIGYWNIRGLSVNMDLPRTLEEDDKVKLIIIKED